MFEDKILIWRYNSGETSVLRMVYDKYKNCLLTVAAAVLYDKSEAEDVLHDIFSRLADTKNPLKIQGNLKAYLCTAAANRNIR
jgi:DNA-directed RNA polymerase specialized sigma24 family protein